MVVVGVTGIDFIVLHGGGGRQRAAEPPRQEPLRQVGVERRIVLVALQVLPVDKRLDPLLEVIDIDVELELRARVS